MSYDKKVDSTQLDADLTSVANAIRAKGGTSSQLSFPSGMVSAVAAIPTGTTPTGTVNITANGTHNVAQYASASVNVSSCVPTEVANSSGMTAVLTDANIGQCYKYTGTTGTYENGNLYIVESSMPTKGQIITMSLGNATPIIGQQDTYRVLSINGNIAYVMAMYDQASIAYNEEEESAVYENSNLDTYLNTTWYNSLSSTAKSAIQSTIIYQDAWGINGTYNPEYIGVYEYADYDPDSEEEELIPENYSVNLYSEDYYQEGLSRKVYALSVKDIIDYLGVTTSMTAVNTTLNHTNLNTMFGGINGDQWLRTILFGAELPNITMIVCVESRLYEDSIYDFNTNYVRPAFRIDLSQIQWS